MSPSDRFGSVCQRLDSCWSYWWGGLAYTAGVGFYAAHRRRYSHFIWHIFVLAGTAFHFFAVLWYAA